MGTDGDMPGERKNATLEKSSEGVKRDTLRRFICYWAIKMSTDCSRQTTIAHFLCLPVKDALPCKDVSGKTYEEDFEDRLQGTSAPLHPATNTDSEHEPRRRPAAAVALAFRS